MTTLYEVFAYNASTAAMLWSANSSSQLSNSKIPHLGLQFVVSGVNTPFCTVEGLDAVTGAVKLTLDAYCGGVDMTLLDNGHSSPIVLMQLSASGDTMQLSTFSPVTGKFLNNLALPPGFVAFTGYYLMRGDSTGFITSAMTANTTNGGIALVKLTWSGTVAWVREFSTFVKPQYDHHATDVFYLLVNRRAVAFDQRTGSVVAESAELASYGQGNMMSLKCGVLLTNDEGNVSQMLALPSCDP